MALSGLRRLRVAAVSLPVVLLLRLGRRAASFFVGAESSLAVMRVTLVVDFLVVATVDDSPNLKVWFEPDCQDQCNAPEVVCQIKTLQLYRVVELEGIGALGNVSTEAFSLAPFTVGKLGSTRTLGNVPFAAQSVWIEAFVYFSNYVHA